MAWLPCCHEYLNIVLVHTYILTKVIQNIFVIVTLTWHIYIYGIIWDYLVLFTKHSCYVDGILSVRNLTIPGLAIFRSPFSWAMASIAISNDQMENKQAVIIHTYTYIWVWVNTYRYIFSGMNIHLPAILGFTRYQGFDTLPYIYIYINILE